MTESDAATPQVTYEVIDGPLSIRLKPSIFSDYLGNFVIGDRITAESGQKTTADGFVWVKHDKGWSAKRTDDKSEVYLQKIADTEGTRPDDDDEDITERGEDIIFKVTDGPLNVRTQPTFSLDSTTQVPTGSEINVDDESRTEAQGFIWWRHRLGWSVEGRADGSRFYMERVQAGNSGDDGHSDDGGSDTGGTGTGGGDGSGNSDTGGTGTGGDDGGITETQPAEKIQFFEVTNGPISFRAEAKATGQYLGQFATGDQIEVKPDSRQDDGSFVWWHHDNGWSAQKNSSGSIVFMTKIDKITKVKEPTGAGEFQAETIFTRLPVSLANTRWIQYFGNSKFAYNIWAEEKTWYKYSQALHGGFDFGNSSPNIPIFAGVNGTVISLERNSRFYAPNYLKVRVGSFQVIYGHIASPNNFNPGDSVTPDTQVGVMDAGGQNHLHLEVRNGPLKIVNPLLLMEDDLRDSIMEEFDNYEDHFYKDNTWNKWQTPLDQPVLTLSGKILGPHAP